MQNLSKVEVRINENLHGDAIIVNRTVTTHGIINELFLSQDAIVSKVEKMVEVRKNENLQEHVIIVNRTMTTSEGTSCNTKA